MGWILTGRSLKLIAAAFILAVGLLPGGQSGSASVALPASYAGKVDPRVLADTAGGKTGSFLVVLAQGAEPPPPGLYVQSPQARYLDAVTRLRQTAQSSQLGVVAALQALARSSAFDVRYQGYWIANAVAVWGKRAVVDAMASRPDVLEIASNRPFRVPLETGEPAPQAATGVEWNIAQVHAPDLWAHGITGQGITYANADTGVSWTHPALQPHYRGVKGSQIDHNYNWWDAIHQQIAPNANTLCPYNSPQPCDDNGHGTHTLGTGIGDDGAGNQVGMAPGAKWMACRNMDQGVGQPSAYIECLQFFVAPWALSDSSHSSPNPALHADVIGNSYSCTPSEGCTAPGVLHQAVENVRAAGIFMAVSAGNSGPVCSTLSEPPASEPGAFTVGAVDQNSLIAVFSSRGPVTLDGVTRVEPDIVAPGVGVVSSVVGGGYGQKNGTSMASPHVAGAVALLWSAYPQLRGNVWITELLLRASAKPITASGLPLCGSDGPASVPNNIYGSGQLDVLAANNLFPLLHFWYMPVVGR